VSARKRVAVRVRKILQRNQALLLKLLTNRNNIVWHGLAADATPENRRNTNRSCGFLSQFDIGTFGIAASTAAVSAGKCFTPKSHATAATSITTETKRNAIVMLV
jgi:hypothetical protein